MIHEVVIGKTEALKTSEKKKLIVLAVGGQKGFLEHYDVCICMYLCICMDVYVYTFTYIVCDVMKGSPHATSFVHPFYGTHHPRSRGLGICR